MKDNRSTPQKIADYFRNELSPSGSNLDEQLLAVAFGALKKRYGSDYNYYIMDSAKTWATEGGSHITIDDIKRIFVETEPNPTKRKTEKPDRFKGMDPIPFDPVWIDCGGE